MSRYLVQRVLQALVTIVVVSIVVFLFVKASGDPAALLVPEEASLEDIAQMRQRLGLDRPLYVQYLSFMANFWRGDAIKSFRHPTVPLMSLLLEAFRWTAVLAVGALLVSLVVAIPFGAFAALKRGSALDVILRIMAVIGQSMPSFWVAMLLMLFFAVKLQILPVSGMGVKHAVLPLTTLAFYQVALLMRLFRSEMLEVMSQDYIRTARSKGLDEARVVIRHAFKNALLPVLTMAGLQISALILGAVVVEPIFAWPGIGHLMVNAVFTRDYPIVVGGAVVAAVIISLVNLLVDILYGWVDPRIRGV